MASVLKEFKKSLKPKAYKKLKEIFKSLKEGHEENQKQLDNLFQLMPEQYANSLQSSLEKLHNTSFLSDPIEASKEANNATRTFAMAMKGMNKETQTKAISLINGTDAIGYEPAGSVLRKLYPNPFAVFAFLGDNYWSAVRARREVRVEIETDGYNFISGDRTPDKRVKLVEGILTDLNILQNRTELIDHLNLFGNCWLRPKRNLYGGIIRYEVLLPEKILPIWDRSSDKLIGWQYHENNSRYIYSPAEIVHLKTYSTRSQYLGAPGLASVVVDMEAAMFASIFNSTLFQKGGMIGSIVALKSMDPGSLINEKNYSFLADAAQSKFDKRYAGLRGAGQIIVSPNVENVFKMMTPGEMDGSFKTITEATDRKVCQLLCCSPEKIGLPATSQYQDKDLVANRVAESFDNNVNYLAGIVDNWINTIIQSVGIKDVTIECGGAYKSSSVAMADYGVKAATMGGVLMVDEWRRMAHMKPFGGTQGRRLLTNPTANKPMGTDANGKPIPPPEPELGPEMDFKEYGGLRVHTKEAVRFYPKYNSLREVRQDVKNARAAS